MTETDPELARIVTAPVFVRGASRPFGELTVDDVRARADELKAATGWGPTARIAPIARAWRELTMAMERESAATIADLSPAVTVELGRKAWVVMPGP